jgi:hypothetical protein
MSMAHSQRGGDIFLDVSGGGTRNVLLTMGGNDNDWDPLTSMTQYYSHQSNYICNFVHIELLIGIEISLSSWILYVINTCDFDGLCIKLKVSSLYGHWPWEKLENKIKSTTDPNSYRFNHGLFFSFSFLLPRIHKLVCNFIVINAHSVGS